MELAINTSIIKIVFIGNFIDFGPSKAIKPFFSVPPFYTFSHCSLAPNVLDKVSQVDILII